MSAWRVNGFVQDSDQEDEYIESCSTRSTNESQRSATALDRPETRSEDNDENASADIVNPAVTNEDKVSTRQTGTLGDRLEDDHQTLRHESPTVTQPLESTDNIPRKNTAQRLNSASIDGNVRETTESPDPLHGSPIRLEQPIDGFAWSSQMLDVPKPSPVTAYSSDKKDGNKGAQESLPPNLSDSDLSDPPSELEDLEPNEIIFHPPSRKTTVQVVIPCSTAIRSSQIQTNEPYIERSFRQRKPIQLHPYLLEGERYRRDLQGRGLKPVTRVLSPPRNNRHNDHESQEQEFDPGADFTPSSPPEVLVATPTPRQSAETSTRGYTRRIAQGLQSHNKGALVLNGAKRRKTNSPSYRSPLRAGQPATDSHESQTDVWTLPQSPPYVCNPGSDTGSCATMHVPDLPTPSSSSNLLPSLDLESDGEPILRSVQRHRQRVRQRPATLGGLETSDAESSEEGVQVSDGEFRQVGKKIKGVLPASWLRLDRQAQVTLNQARPINPGPPNTAEHQRGIARRVSRPKGTSYKADRLGHTGDAISVSDDSSDSGDEMAMSTSEAQATACAAPEEADMNDYPYADEESEEMENDSLHLFRLGGVAKKRRIQSKLTDAFKQTLTRYPRHTRIVLSKASAKARKSRHVPPPALSILDFDQSPASNQKLPSFLRIAQRQARRRADNARQSPTGKFIRLHTAQDTEDANVTLQQWKRGAIKPRTNAIKMLHKPPQRIPLSNLDQNHRISVSDNDPLLVASKENPSPPMQDLRLSRRRGVPSKLLSKASERQHRAGLRQHNDSPFRNAQIECLSNEFNGGNCGRAFGHELRCMDRQFDLRHLLDRHPRNLQLSRFLESEEAGVPSLPSLEGVENETAKALYPNTTIVKSQQKRKPQAHRVDVDTREYRQPSEPIVDNYLKTLPSLTGSKIAHDGDITSTLQGLDVHGTRYSTTFDIASVHDGTYFQVNTFVGSGELRRALAMVGPNPRNLDEATGHCVLDIKGTHIRCGPWEDSIFAHFADVASDMYRATFGIVENGTQVDVLETCLANTTQAVRSLVDYVSTYLNFHDPVDRRSFVSRMAQWASSMFESIIPNRSAILYTSLAKFLALLLVLCAQICKIAQHPAVEPSARVALGAIIAKISKSLVGHILDHAADLSEFLENNNRFHIRENGIRESDSLVESLVICMHILSSENITGTTFWELVNQSLSPTAGNSVHVAEFEAVWGTLFTLLPFIEFDSLGLPSRHRRLTFEQDRWNVIRILLQRMFALYPETSKRDSASINAYIRAVLMRCHGLIHYWHWTHCESILYSMFDFFVAKNGLQPLSGEKSLTAAAFLEQIDDRSFSYLEPNDKVFHVFLKCLFVGIQGMRSHCTEKKLRSVVLRLIPNHGRNYPKDQPLEMAHLAALGNHHDIMCTLYRASPPPCRPKLDQMRALVEHGVSHREACRISIHAWANLSAFQLSTDEPYENAQPFAEWHQEIMMRTLKQYLLAKTEAEEYMHSRALDDSEPSSLLARQFMEKNQNQVVTTLRDCIGGIRRVITVCNNHSTLKAFLVDSNIVHLLQLSHLQDQRLIVIIRDALEVLRAFASLPQQVPDTLANTEQTEESQDYGEPLHLDDFMEIDEAASQADTFLQTALWRLLSNAFGAETAPDDNVLTDCVETWCLAARSQVLQGTHSWTFYLDPFSQVSWQQLRRTEQTQTFGPFFMASVLACDSTAYAQHRITFLDACLTSLADRDSKLKFQHRLLSAIFYAAPQEPLLRNLPFLVDASTGTLVVEVDTLRTRRLGLISSILANMRDDFQRTTYDHPERITEVRGTYAGMLKNLMSAMKNNYLQLNLGTGVTGAYVEFVQHVVQFLQQHTADIQPVLEFFTNSVAFPLPAEDPAYIIGRLCGYAAKLSKPGVTKQLSVFIQTVAQQAATGNHQHYLMHQVQTALQTDTASIRDRVVLRDVLLQGIFPAYIEAAFTSPLGFVVAHPILQSLEPIVHSLLHDVRVYDEENVQAICSCLLAITRGFSSSIEQLEVNEEKLHLPYILQALSGLFRIATPTATLLRYIWGRCSRSLASPTPMPSFENFALFVKERLHGMDIGTIPRRHDDFGAMAAPAKYSELLKFSIEGLRSCITTNWSCENERMYFGQGQAKREVFFEWGAADVQKAALISTLESFLKHVLETRGEGRIEDIQTRDGHVGCIDV